ncbi:MAG: indolepyruvate oxidoreductase subunit beta [Desulfurococcaceae archaeon]
MGRKYNIAIVGVGGQGLLTLGSIIGVAGIVAGLDISVAEVHGMSQRGGSVIVHVRIGENPSPIIPMGGADHILALELLEAARYISYARRNAVITANDFIWPPPLANYPSRETILNRIREKEVSLYVFNANEFSRKIIGSPISANIAMLGFALGVDQELGSIIDVKHVEEALSEHFKDKVVEANRNILRMSYQEGLKYAEEKRRAQQAR